MIEYSLTEPEHHYSPRASLAALALKIRELEILEPIERLLHIAQKTVKYRPIDKLHHALIAILAGAHATYQVNRLVRPDIGLLQAFGFDGCAEQSVIQETLDACSKENVAQFYQALNEILQKHSQAYHHNYQLQLQILDIDITGLPCGKKSDEALKGYFSDQGIRYGRQLGRVVAAQYEEIIVDRLYPGNVQLPVCLQWLITDAEAALALDETKRQRTIIRVDAGGGSFDDVIWMCQRGYQIHCKAFSTVHARFQAQYVKQWFTDPHRPERQLGWSEGEHLYDDGWHYPEQLRRLVLKWTNSQGQSSYALLLSTLAPEQVISLLHLPAQLIDDPTAVACAYAKLYDKRGGTIEIENKEDKQIGLVKRAKKRFEAQQMIVALNTLAHNLLVWARNWLKPFVPKLGMLGLLRMVRDILQISGFISIDDNGIDSITLNHLVPAATQVANAFDLLLTNHWCWVRAGKT
jgi:hypothetical protein